MFQIEGTIVIALLSAALGAASFWIARRKDSSEEGRLIGALMTEVGYVKSNTDTIMKKIDKLEERNTRVEATLGRYDEIIKESHRRLDDLEHRVGALEKGE